MAPMSLNPALSLHYRDAEKCFTERGLEAAVSARGLALRSVRKVPFVIPDADGTFQITFSNCTVFQKE